jgi:hypothetical protein
MFPASNPFKGFPQYEFEKSLAVRLSIFEGW